MKRTLVLLSFLLGIGTTGFVANAAESEVENPVSGVGGVTSCGVEYMYWFDEEQEVSVEQIEAIAEMAEEQYCN